MKYVTVAIIAILVLVGLNATTASAAVKLPANPTYVALGDSVAAGAGLPTTDAICARSPQAYPNQIAASLGTSVTSLACSGAKIDEGLYGPQVRGGTTLTPQIDQALSTSTPDLMTITIGANDARWIEFMTKCYISTCGSTFDSAAAKVLRVDLRGELSAALYRIKNLSTSGVPPKVLISGYYNPLSNAQCLGEGRVTLKELSWIRNQTNSLNQAIRSVTPYFKNVTYVPISVTGHELCSKDPWVQGITAAAPLHPTAAGQAAIAQSFVKVITK